MKIIVKSILLLLAVLFFIYLIIPGSGFPTPATGWLQSEEPADVETPLRRAYYTDATREEVIDIYKNSFHPANFSFLDKLVLRLNYPPEESQTLIRDQTRSTFLEELVYPFKESVFINGYEPTQPQYLIRIDEKLYRQKIIVKYIPSNVYTRILMGILTIISIVFLVKGYKNLFKP